MAKACRKREAYSFDNVLLWNIYALWYDRRIDRANINRVKLPCHEIVKDNELVVLFT